MAGTRSTDLPPARSGHQLYENERPDLVEVIPSDARTFLDVGCGPGQLGLQLKARGADRVVGVELNPEAAAIAATRLDEVVTCDVENEPLPFADGSFDCIVYGDVLEHLIDPWTVLSEHRRLLRAGGVVVVSLPNIGYWKVVRDLLRGRWEYTANGTLDVTHLRFFTRRSAEELCRRAGFGELEVHTSLPTRGKAARLNALTGGRLEHLLVWRYLIVARAS